MLNNIRAGHRKRTIKKFLASGSQMPIVDIIEIMLFLSIPRKDVKELAHKITKKYDNNLTKILTVNNESIAGIEGIGESTFLFFKLIYEIAIRIQKEKFEEKDVIKSKRELVLYCRIKTALKEKEELLIIFLNAKNKILSEEVLFIGSIDSVSVYPREIIKRCLYWNTSKIFLVHNHPSGVPSPSQNDINLTNSLRHLCSLLNIGLCDHVIIGTNHFYSFEQQEILPYFPD